MCGIVGIISPSEPVDRDLLVRMRDTLRHRGPDDAGVWLAPDCRVGLAHRRLAVIDVSAAGHQPMTDARGELWIALNGEIYNYKELRADLEERGVEFRTATDTEVVLGAYRVWGDGCVAHLAGMFALALYDTRDRHVLIARDRAGEKPLYFAHDGGRLVFASELKALLADPACPRSVDPDAVDDYLAFGYVPGPRTILSGISKLRPGEAARYDVESRAFRPWTYWRLPPLHTPAEPVDAETLTDELEELLSASVRRQVVADVPLGILLSGGIDSSLVTALAAREWTGRVRTFTVTFPGHQDFDEGPHARRVASYFGTEHTELAATAPTTDLLSELARQFDEPLGDSSMVPTFMVSRLIRQHATVALGGDGGDELFAGYTRYLRLAAQARLRRVLPGPISRAGHLVAARLPLGLPGRNYLLELTATAPSRVAHSEVFDPRSRAQLLPGNVPSGAPRAFACSGAGLIDRATRVDFATYLPDDILVKTDRASMMNSLELRAPWLDHHVVEFAFTRVPVSLKTHNGNLKILPRRLAKRLLPPDIDFARKQGFAIPFQAWFDGPWGAYVEQLLLESPFDKAVVRRLIQGQHARHGNHNRLFTLAMFELWRREYRVSL